MNTTKFKVGDRIKIAYHKGKYYRGKLGTVTQAHPLSSDFFGLGSTGSYKIRLDGNQTDLPYWANDDDIELI